MQVIRRSGSGQGRESVTRRRVVVEMTVFPTPMSQGIGPTYHKMILIAGFIYEVFMLSTVFS